MKKSAQRNLVLTGGGTAGHVTPNIALLEKLDKAQWNIAYVGSETGIEKQLIATQGIPYHAIKTGKMRRYFSWKNIWDPFLIVYGIGQSFFLLRRLKTDLVFSKGGFVAFPVVFAAWLQGIPVIAHESDMTPGLANRLCYPFVKYICINFASGQKFYRNTSKLVVTGTPIRQALFQGKKERGLALCHFNAEKPCLLVIGGSLGAASINRVVRDALPLLLPHFQIIHVCGKSNIDAHLQDKSGYQQFEYVHEELADLFAAADVVVSRAGANAVCEILALNKPHVFIPLSARVSRGDQIHNARYFMQQQVSTVIEDEALTPEGLLAAVMQVHQNAPQITAAIEALGVGSATDRIIQLF